MNLIIRRGIRHFAALRGCRKVASGCQQDASPCKKGCKKRSGCLEGVSGCYPAGEGGYKAWRNISLFICLPLILLCAYNVATTYHPHDRLPFRKYEYMYIRHKKFPNGTDKSFFHNPHLNALPDGYEDGNNEGEVHSKEGKC